jgi:hypothetical protein
LFLFLAFSFSFTLSLSRSHSVSFSLVRSCYLLRARSCCTIFSARFSSSVFPLFLSEISSFTHNYTHA